MSSIFQNRWLRWGAALLVLIAAAFGAKIYYDTMRDPQIKRLGVTTDQLPVGSAPVRLALVADIHMAGPDMTPERVERIVSQVNALGADIILIAGDLVSQKGTATRTYQPDEVIAPLGKLEARDGVVLVPGNHDHWYGWDDLSRELEKFPHITVLENEAGRFGPLAIGGVDDEHTGNDDVEATLAAMEPLTGARVVLTHTPDVFPDLPQDIVLTMAGHTHCGQIAYPWGGSPFSMSAYGDEYACGVVERGAKTLVTSGGLGTSVLPLRLFTHPEIWLIEIGPASAP